MDTNLVNSFFKEKEKSVKFLHNMFYKHIPEITLNDFIVLLEEDLKIGCKYYLDKEYPIEEINDHFLYIANEFCKKNFVAIPKKEIQYFCPGCMFLGVKSVLKDSIIFNCNSCSLKLKTSTNPKEQYLLSIFAKHNKSGCRCPSCNRFIPYLLDKSTLITCPYFDCCFIGDAENLKKMHHPSDLNSKRAIKFLIENQQVNSELKSEDSRIINLKNIIESKCNEVPYNSFNYMIKHKTLIYKAISNLLDKDSKMFDYLANNSRSGGFQHKIFQEYIRLLEKSFPFCYKKKGKIISINNLMDPNLNVFYGLSSFDAVVNDKLCIKNNTEEFYIGGRAATYSQPFYIGKLLNIVNKRTKESLMNNVIEYSFSKIKMKNVLVGTPVSISHLRIPPHYQLGAMSYINRVRKELVANYVR